VDENMKSAHRRDGVKSSSFFFRRNVFNSPVKDMNGDAPLADGERGRTVSAESSTSKSNTASHLASLARSPAIDDESLDTYESMSIDEIINGGRVENHANGSVPNGYATHGSKDHKDTKAAPMRTLPNPGQSSRASMDSCIETGFPGLIPLINSYLDSIDLDIETRCAIQKYLNFVSARASGRLITCAAWMRRFVQQHPAYKQDSVVSQEINYDLCRAMEKITKGELRPEELFGDFV
jgi:glutamate--cysteine ligase catalytic subunit